MPSHVSVIGLEFLLCVSLFAEPGAGETPKAADDIFSTADYAKTAKEYEDQAQRQNKMLQNLQSVTGTAEAPPPTRVPASAQAPSACSSVDSFAAFKACVGERFDKFNGTPDVAKEMPKDP